MLPIYTFVKTKKGDAWDWLGWGEALLTMSYSLPSIDLALFCFFFLKILFSNWNKRLKKVTTLGTCWWQVKTLFGSHFQTPDPNVWDMQAINEEEQWWNKQRNKPPKQTKKKRKPETFRFSLDSISGGG